MSDDTDGTEPGRRTGHGLYVLLLGPTGSGRMKWAREHFARTDIVSIGDIREQICGDPGDQSATHWARPVLRDLLIGRLHYRRPTVVHASVTDILDGPAGPGHWASNLPGIGYGFGCPPLAIVFETPLDECLRRNKRRPAGRRADEQQIHDDHARLRATMPVESTWGTNGFDGMAWVMPDASMRVGGFAMVRRVQNGTPWLAGARDPQTPTWADQPRVLRSNWLKTT